MSKGFSVKTAMGTLSILAAATGFCGLTATAARAADTPVAIGISGWTGFAPLTLADKAGIFKSMAWMSI